MLATVAVVEKLVVVAELAAKRVGVTAVKMVVGEVNAVTVVKAEAMRKAV